MRQIRQFTGRPPKPSAVRDELLIKVQALDVGDGAAVRDLIIERQEWSEAKVQRYERLRNRILDGLQRRGFLPRRREWAPYLTLMRGISFEEENVRWAKRALAIVEQRQGAGSVS